MPCDDRYNVQFIIYGIKIVGHFDKKGDGWLIKWFISMPDVYKCLFKRFYFAWIGLGWVGLGWMVVAIFGLKNIVEKKT